MSEDKYTGAELIEEISLRNKAFCDTTFCPIRNDKCRIDCVCFVTAHLGYGDQMLQPKCSHKLLT